MSVYIYTHITDNEQILKNDLLYLDKVFYRGKCLAQGLVDPNIFVDKIVYIVNFLVRNFDIRKSE